MSYLDGSLRAGVVSSACETAYAQEISCDDSLYKVFNQNSDSSSNEADKFSNSTLNSLCTDICLKGLQKWRDDVRRECSPNDFKEGSEKETGAGLTIIAQVMDVNKKVVEYLYWSTCTRDLDTGAFCFTELEEEDTEFASSNDAENTPEIIDAFCKSSCMVQMSLYAWDILSSIAGGFTDTINIGDARKLCKGLDTSKFPYYKNSSSSSGNGSSSSSSSDSTTTSRNGNGTGGSGTGGSSSGAVGRNGVSAGMAIVVITVAVVGFLG